MKSAPVYSYTYKNTPGDFLRFRLGNTYSQWTGIVNVVFTAAMVGLIARFWNATNGLGKGLMVLGVLLFPLFQPLAMWLSGIKQAASIEPETTLELTEQELVIRVLVHEQRIPWKKCAGLQRRLGITILIPDASHAYLLPDRVTGSKAKEVYAFLQEHLPAAKR